MGPKNILVYRKLILVFLGSVFGLSVFAHEVQRPERPSELILGTSTDPAVYMRGSQVVLLMDGALRRDRPEFSGISRKNLKRIALKYSLLSKAQIPLHKIRFGAPVGAAEIDFDVLESSGLIPLFRQPEYYRAATVALEEFDRFMLEIKGVGNPPSWRVAEQLAEYQRALISKDPQAALTALQRKDHSDGLMSLGEALAEAARQHAAQLIFDQYNALHGTNFQTIETYFVIKLPFHILKGNGESIPAALYARQAHWGRRYLSSAPEGTIDAKFRFIQQSFLGGMVDWGGVFIRASQFMDSFLTGGSLTDPQYSKIWGEAHDVARQIDAGDSEAAERWFKRLFGPSAFKYIPPPQPVAEETAELKRDIEEFTRSNPGDFRNIFKLALKIWKMSPSGRAREFAGLSPAELKVVLDVTAQSQLKPFEVFSDLTAVGIQELLLEIIEKATSIDQLNFLPDDFEKAFIFMGKFFARANEVVSKWPPLLMNSFLSCLKRYPHILPDLEPKLVNLIVQQYDAAQPNDGPLLYLASHFHAFSQASKLTIVTFFERQYEHLSLDVRLLVNSLVLKEHSAFEDNPSFLTLKHRASNDPDTFIRATAYMVLGTYPNEFSSLAAAYNPTSPAVPDGDEFTPQQRQDATMNFIRAMTGGSHYVRMAALNLYLKIVASNPLNYTSVLFLFRNVIQISTHDEFKRAVLAAMIHLPQPQPGQNLFARKTMLMFFESASSEHALNDIIQALLNHQDSDISRLVLDKINSVLATQGGWESVTKARHPGFRSLMKWSVDILELSIKGTLKLPTVELMRLKNFVLSRRTIAYFISQAELQIQDVGSLRRSCEAVETIFEIVKLENLLRMLGQMKGNLLISHDNLHMILRRIEAIGNAPDVALGHNIGMPEDRYDYIVRNLGALPLRNFKNRRDIRRFLFRTSVFANSRETRRGAEEALTPEALNDGLNSSLVVNELESTSDDQIKLRLLRIIARLASEQTSLDLVLWDSRLAPVLNRLASTPGGETEITKAAKFAQDQIAQANLRCQKALEK